MNKTGKTPYEIRLELLQLAVDILKAKHSASADADAKRRWELGNGVNAPNIFYVSAATTEEIIAEAEKLNGFVSKANPHQ